MPSLPAFGIDIEELRGVITRLAILDDSPPSQAVLNGLLALATLYKSGNSAMAAKHVASALCFLRTSAQDNIEVSHGLQHIVAGILICSYEVS